MLVRRVDCSDAQTLYWVEAILVQDGSGLRSNLNGRSIFGDFSFWTKLAQNLVSKRTTRLHIILIDALLTSNPSIASLINIFKNLKYIFEKSTN